MEALRSQESEMLGNNTRSSKDINEFQLLANALAFPSFPGTQIKRSSSRSFLIRLSTIYLDISFLLNETQQREFIQTLLYQTSRHLTPYQPVELPSLSDYYVCLSFFLYAALPIGLDVFFTQERTPMYFTEMLYLSLTHRGQVVMLFEYKLPSPSVFHCPRTYSSLFVCSHTKLSICSTRLHCQTNESNIPSLFHEIPPQTKFLTTLIFGKPTSSIA